MSRNPENRSGKRSWYSHLNRVSETIDSIPKKHSLLWCLVIIVVVGLTSIYDFVERIRQGGSFLKAVAVTAIAFVFLVLFTRDFLAARKQEYKYFWGSWLVATICFVLFVGRLFQESFRTRQIINLRYEVLFERALATEPQPKNNISVAGNLGAGGYRAFNNGDYAYAVKFYERDFAEVGEYDQQRGLQWPMYAASKLALDPTPDGHEQFHEDLEAMVKHLQMGFDERKGRTDQNYYGAIIERLYEVKAKLTEDEEKEFVDGIVDQVRILRNSSSK